MEGWVMEEKDKEYSILQNFGYCIKATIQNYPKLLVLCVRRSKEEERQHNNSELNKHSYVSF